MSEPKIYSTTEWGARPPNRTGFTQRPAEGIVVHNTEHRNRAPLMGDEEKQEAFQVAQNIQRDHLSRRDRRTGRLWSDTGQHFTISRGGIIMEGRHGSLAAAQAGKVVQASHANDAYYNQTWFGVELEGYYVREYAMTDEQWEALVELCAWLSFWGEFAPGQIKGHQEVSSTDCPGLVMEHLDELRERVRSRKEQIVSGNH